MKHMNQFKLFKNNKLKQKPSQFPKKEVDIHNLCKKYHITNYTINDNLSIDVDGSVNLRGEYLDYLPLKFNKISGFLDCEYNNLKSFKYFPKEVEDGIFISLNPIYSLVYNFIENPKINFLIEEFNLYGIISPDETTVYWHRYTEFCEDYDIEMVNIDEVRKDYTVIE